MDQSEESNLLSLNSHEVNEIFQLKTWMFYLALLFYLGAIILGIISLITLLSNVVVGLIILAETIGLAILGTFLVKGCNSFQKLIVSDENQKMNLMFSLKDLKKFFMIHVLVFFLSIAMVIIMLSFVISGQIKW